MPTAAFGFDSIHLSVKLVKKSSITYRELANRLELSESAVKQMFASNNFSLKRLDEICDVLGLDITELVDIASSRQQPIEELLHTNTPISGWSPACMRAPMDRGGSWDAGPAKISGKINRKKKIGNKQGLCCQQQ